MDLLTRGAGFGYLGSTITSLVYASVHLHLLRTRGGDPRTRAAALLRLADRGVLSRRLARRGAAGDARHHVDPAPAVVDTAGLAIAVGAALSGGAARSARRCLCPTSPRWSVAFRTAARVRRGDVRLPPRRSRSRSWCRSASRSTTCVSCLRKPPPIASAGGARWWSPGPGWIVPGMLKMLGGAFLAFLAMTARDQRSRRRSSRRRCTLPASATCLRFAGLGARRDHALRRSSRRSRST